MTDSTNSISSLSNPGVKHVVKLRQRSHRDEMNLMIIEGYREIKRALENNHTISKLFTCSELFQGENEPALIEKARAQGAELFECSTRVFEKMAYRDRPEGLLALAEQVRMSLSELTVPKGALIVVAQSIEKPGNLGTILRSSDAVGADAVIVCDRCTDINNPNVVRASIGTIFSIPVIEAQSKDALKWLEKHEFKTLAATPHAQTLYTDVDMKGNIAIVIGSEQYGLSDEWITDAHMALRIPMLGQADSLNVASATTILLYEAIRQRKPIAP